MVPNANLQIILFVMVLGATEIHSECTYHNSLTDSTVSWFTHYDKTDSIPWVLDFVNPKWYLWKKTGDTDNLSINNTCLESLLEGDTMYLKYMAFGSYHCFVASFTEESFYYRTFYIRGTDQIDTCKTFNGYQETSRWALKYPFPTLTYKCPFNMGYYQTTYNDGQTEMCIADTASTATVDINQHLLINSCYSGNAKYRIPSPTTLTCIASLPGNKLDGTNNGELLYLGDFTKSDSNFYCARYILDGSTFKVSFEVKDHSEASCTYGQNYSSSAFESFTAFVFSYQGALTTTTTTTTTVATTTQSTTSPLSTTSPKPSTTAPIQVCPYPAGWTDNEWWTGYYDDTRSHAHYQFTTFSNQKLYHGNDLEETYKCVESDLSGNPKYLVQHVSGFETQKYCKLVEDSINRVIVTSDSVLKGSSITISTCPDFFTTLPQFDVLLQYPFSYMSSCPFADGSYQLTLHDSFERFDQCARTRESTLNVTSNQLFTHACIDSDTYDKPYRSMFSCVSSWSSGTIHGTSNEGDGYLILAYEDPYYQRTQFYCARYNTLGSLIHVSLHIEKDQLRCDTSKSATSEGANYVHFTLTNLGQFTTPPTTQPPSTTTSPTSPVTTKPPSTTSIPTVPTTTKIADTTTKPSTDLSSTSTVPSSSSPNSLTAVRSTTLISSTPTTTSSAVPSANISSSSTTASTSTSEIVTTASSTTQSTSTSSSVSPTTLTPSTTSPLIPCGGTCLNKGVCNGTRNTCDCVTGFIGALCQTEIDDCQDSPCKNEANCIDLIGGYFCECPKTYYGETCRYTTQKGWGLQETVITSLIAFAVVMLICATVIVLYVVWSRRRFKIRYQIMASLEHEVGGSSGQYSFSN